MLLLSPEFVALSGSLLVLYWAFPRWQNVCLLVANLLFFLSWSVTSLVGVVLSASLEWWIAGMIIRSSGKRRRNVLLCVSVVGNALAWLFLLGTGSLGGGANAPDASDPRGWLIVVGFSFWTLQKLTYTLDIYLGLRRSEAPFLEFLTFTSFLPTALCGPVETAGNLLDQMSRRRHMEPRWVAEGCWLLGLGIFKKVFIAGHCHEIWLELRAPEAGGSLALLQVLFYALVLYADFSGYSDMARGLARLLGLHIQENFRAPYFSRSLPEYWQRWHSSLYRWLYSYVFLPANIRLRSFDRWGLGIAILLTFLASAAWHGGGWHYVAWALIHAVGMIIYVLGARWRRTWGAGRSPNGAYDLGCTMLTFAWVLLGLVFFSATDIGQAFQSLRNLATLPFVRAESLAYAILWLQFAALTCVVHAIEDSPRGAFSMLDKPKAVRVCVYAMMMFLVLRLPGRTAGFIYQQF